MKKCKIRIQGDEKTIALVREYLLSVHPGMIMSQPRKGTNPKYDGDQKYSCYGDIEFTTLGKVRQKEKKRKRKK